MVNVFYALCKQTDRLMTPQIATCSRIWWRKSSLSLSFWCDFIDKLAMANFMDHPYNPYNATIHRISLQRYNRYKWGERCM